MYSIARYLDEHEEDKAEVLHTGRNCRLITTCLNEIIEGYCLSDWLDMENDQDEEHLKQVEKDFLNRTSFEKFSVLDVWQDLCVIKHKTPYLDEHEVHGDIPANSVPNKIMGVTKSKKKGEYFFETKYSFT